MGNNKKHIKAERLREFQRQALLLIERNKMLELANIRLRDQNKKLYLENEKLKGRYR